MEQVRNRCSAWKTCDTLTCPDMREHTPDEACRTACRNGARCMRVEPKPEPKEEQQCQPRG